MNPESFFMVWVSFDFNVCRWDGRPTTPPFKWGPNGEELPPHDAWLANMDLKAEGMGSLVCTFLKKQDENHEASDLALVRDTLIKNGGALQALFLYYEWSGQKNPDTIGRMIMTQFRALMQVRS